LFLQGLIFFISKEFLRKFEGTMIVVYVLEGANKRYVGITNNLKRRLSEHKSGHTKGSQIIGQFKLLHTEEFADYPSARQRNPTAKLYQC
jgi:predicted GIY-YIG superfamily endonuclease